MELKVLVSPSGNRVVGIIDGEIIGTEQKEDEKLVPLDNFNDFLKPLYNGSSWVESASEAELKSQREEYKGLLDYRPNDIITGQIDDDDTIAMAEAIVNLEYRLLLLEGGLDND